MNPSSRPPPRALSRAEIRQRLQSQSSSSPSTAAKPTRKAHNPKNIDITKTKAYKSASRRWISTIVALPILIYTSWELYERTYGSKVQKKLGRESTGNGEK